MIYRQANSRRDAMFICGAGEMFGLDIVTIQEELTEKPYSFEMAYDPDRVGRQGRTVRIPQLSGKWHVWMQGSPRSCAVYQGKKYSDLDNLAAAIREDAIASVEKDVKADNE